jgi:hypothetical protein
VDGVAIAVPHAIATIAAAVANMVTRFIIFSFSSLILNGDLMKTSLVPSLHVLLKLIADHKFRNSKTVFSTAENVPICVKAIITAS